MVCGVADLLLPFHAASWAADWGENLSHPIPRRNPPRNCRLNKKARSLRLSVRPITF